MASFSFPGGKKFAFTVFDDTDVATLANVEPIYHLLDHLGMRTTKTVWPVGCPEGSPNFSQSDTLEDPAYLRFALHLQSRGFELTWHCATMESSTRDRTVDALERFHSLFGHYPRLHANHSLNRENIYWGHHRFDQPLIRLLMRRLLSEPPDHYQGHVESSPYFWGDLALRHFEYGRNLTFNTLTLSSINPSMPYRDPRRPFLPWWFSCSDAEDCTAFNHLLRPEEQDRLESEGGFTIVATHFGKGYVRDGRVDPLTVKRLESLARRPGWFPTAGELLDWLRARRKAELLPDSEWRRMQKLWAFDLVRRKWQQKMARQM